MYINLGSCDESLSVGGKGPHRFPSGVTYAKKPFATNHKLPSTKLFQSRRAPSLYGIRTLSGLGEYDFEDENLGKLKLKKIVKSVTKAAGQSLKVVATPIAYTASSSLNAVGLRNAAGKVNKAVAVSKGELKTLNAASKAAGWAIDAAGVVVGGAIAAPYVASAASTVGGVVAHGATVAGGLLSKVGGTSLLSKLTGLIKKPSAGGGDSGGGDSGSATGPGFMDTAKSVMSDLGLTPSTAQGPTAGLAMPFQGAANGGASAGGDGASAPAGTTEAGVNPLMGDLSGFLSNPKMLLVAAGGTFLLYMVNRKKSGGRSRRGGRK